MQSKRKTISPHVRFKIYHRDDWRCWFCGTRTEICTDKKGKDCTNEASLEHLNPVSRGGSDNESNLVTACRTCNTQKKDRTLDEYRDYIRYFTTQEGRAVTYLKLTLDLAPSKSESIQQIIDDIEGSLPCIVFHGEAVR